MCVLAVLAGHVLVLYLLGNRSLSLSSGLAASGMTFQTRVVDTHALPQAEANTPASDAQSATNGRLAAQQEAGDTATVLSGARNSTDTERRRYDQFDYVPREFLSVTPTPLSVIEVPFPESVTNEFRMDVPLALFIDENGVVQRVRVEGVALPPVLEDAAVAAFRQARFTPGQVDGQVVRSLIKVAVTFEAQAVKRSEH